MPLGYLYVFFGEMSIQVFHPFLNWVVIFSHSVGCLFVLFMVSFAVQKLFSFIRSHLFIFVFISISLGAESKRILL